MRRKSSPARHPPRAPRPKPGGDEIVIIGSGAVGAACASALARAGRRVRVLSAPGRSTTAISGGHLLLQSKQPGPVLELARRSLALVAEFAAGQEEELGYRQAGSLLLAAGPEEEALLRPHHEALRAADLPLEWLDGPAMREREPEVAPSVTGASFCPLDAQVHPAALAGAWLQEAVSHRAAVTSGAPVESFVRSGGQVVGVVAGGLEYPARAVILAAGPWSGELARMAGLELDLHPRRGVLLRARSERPLAGRPLLGASYLAAKFGAPAAAARAAFSFQQHPDGDCVLGGTRELVEWSLDDLDSRAAEICVEASRYLPALADLPWEPPVAGFRPWASRGEPYLGPSELPGLYLACGFEGDGVTLAAAAAERLAAMFAG